MAVDGPRFEISAAGNLVGRHAGVVEPQCLLDGVGFRFFLYGFFLFSKLLFGFALAACCSGRGFAVEVVQKCAGFYVKIGAGGERRVGEALENAIFEEDAVAQGREGVVVDFGYAFVFDVDDCIFSD